MTNIIDLEIKINSITQIVNWLKEGKKITEKGWNDNEYMFLKDKNKIVLENNEPYNIDIEELIENNWEIYKEK